jgi:formiminotetrahydrofolate cyclodeaminase
MRLRAHGGTPSRAEIEVLFVSHAGAPTTRDSTLDELCRRLADPVQLAGGGVAAAASAALAASLAELVVRLSLRRRANRSLQAELSADQERLAQLRDTLLAASDTDIAAFVNLMAAQRLARDTGDRTDFRVALQTAASSPLELSGSALAVLEISANRIANAAPFAASDLVAAAALAGGAIDAALAMADVNLVLMRAERDPALDEAVVELEATRASLTAAAKSALARVLESIPVDHAIERTFE